MKEPVSFSSQDQEKTSLNFSKLREKGIEYVQQLSGNVWTDFNSHDPGVTILEQLSYALTDVSLRATYDIKDLLTKINDKNEARVDTKKNSFIAPSQIYKTHPVTILDLKKSIIDAFDDIENVWIKPSDNSGAVEKLILTRVIEIQPKSIFKDRLLRGTSNQDTFLNQVNHFIKTNRNLGEDVEQICLLQPKKTIINFKVHLIPHKPIEKTLAHVLMSLFEYVYNPVSQLSLEDMLNANYTISNVFSGPQLKKGFIKDQSLKDRLTRLDKLELQQELSKVDNILKCEVLNFHFNDTSKTDALTISPTSFFHLLEDVHVNEMPEDTFATIYNHMSVLVNDKEIELSTWSKTNINQILHELWAKKYRQYPINYNQNYEYTKNLKGTHRDIDIYYSLQNQFPSMYGIGKEGLSSSESTSRHAKAKQLKAYLLFFEHYLANHLSQINQIDSFFNRDLDLNSNKKTYYSQDLSSVPNIEAVSPNPIFKLDACVYYSEKNDKRIYKEADIDNERLIDLSIEKQQTLLARILTERKLFNTYLRQTRGQNIPIALRFGNKEVQEYLDMLYSLKFKWFEDEIDKNFGRSVILSFAMLMKFEQKYFTPVVFIESFRHHLKRMLTAIGKENLLPTLFKNLKKVDVIKKDHLLSFKKFVTLYEFSIKDATEPHFFNRKSRVYDHLLSRFGEGLNPTPWNVSRRVDLIKSEDELKTTLLKQKSAYLKNIENLTAEIAKGEAFICGHNNNNNKVKRHPSGLENIIAAKTGISPRYFRGDKNNIDAFANDETFYIVDHILLRTFLTNNDVQFGFKFVDPLNKLLCGTTALESWCETEEEREIHISQFYKTFENQDLFNEDIKDNPLLKKEIYNRKFTSKVLATFSNDYITKNKVLDLISLFYNLSQTKERSRLREVEKIRAKGLSTVKRGAYGQRRLIYQRKLINFPKPGNNEEIDEDFFNLSISIVLPEEPIRFKDKQFKHYIHELITERVPSHIKVNILWLGNEDMSAFKSVYLKWENLKADELKSNDKLKTASFAVYKKMIGFNKKLN